MSDQLSPCNPLEGIPDYDGSMPVEFSLRCHCGLRYIILTSAKMVGDVVGRAQERAKQLNATFVDMRITPFLNCSYGEVLDFLPDESTLVM